MTAETRPEVGKIETIKTRVADAERGLEVQGDRVDAAVKEAGAKLQAAELRGREIETKEHEAVTTEQKAKAVEQGGGL